MFALPLFMAPALQCSSQDRHPSFIIIFVDDLGYGDLGCYGHPTIMTPNIDNMADEGMRFTQFYVGAAVCSPSRAALLTGRLAIRTGVYGTIDPVGNRGVVFLQNSIGGLPASEITIAEMLKEKGYATGLIGKWHLGHQPEFLPGKQGFDYWFGIDHHQNGVRRAPSIATDRLNPSGEEERAVKRPWCSLYRNDTVIEENPDMRYLTKRYTDEALRFISRNKDRPFFLYFANNNPHVPLYATEDFEGKSKRGIYGDVVEEIDWSVGKILEKLKELGIDRNTLVWFISDNGPWLQRRQNGGSAGLLREGKNSTWEGGMRVPCIAWWPGTVPAGGVSPSLIAAMDLFPTFAGLSGAKIPGDRTFDGVDITGVMKGAQGSPREFIYYYINDKLYAVRKGPWKAHFITHDSYTPDLPVVHEIPLLYHLEVDPSEKYDLSGKFPGIVEELTREYEKQKLIRPVPSEIDKVMENQN